MVVVLAISLSSSLHDVERDRVSLKQLLEYSFLLAQRENQTLAVFTIETVGKLGGWRKTFVFGFRKLERFTARVHRCLFCFSFFYALWQTKALRSN